MEGSWVQRSIVEEALAIRRQWVSAWLKGDFLGAPWYQVVLGVCLWHLASPPSFKKFGLEELRLMVYEARDGKWKLQKNYLEL